MRYTGLETEGKVGQTNVGRYAAAEGIGIEMRRFPIPKSPGETD